MVGYLRALQCQASDYLLSAAVMVLFCQDSNLVATCGAVGCIMVDYLIR
jgi:hypothetical protein